MRNRRLVLIPDGSKLFHLHGAEFTLAGLGNEHINEMMLGSMFGRIVSGLEDIKNKAPFVAPEVDALIATLPVYPPQPASDSKESISPP